jgi:hypothetical protein
MNRQWRVRLICLVAIAITLLSLELIRRAYFSSTDVEFGRYAGWANILAFLGSALALLFPMIQSALARRGAESSRDKLRDSQEELARAVADRAGEQRKLLLGLDTPDVHAIDVDYHQELTRYRTAGGEDAGSLTTIAAYYRELNPGRLVILGEPGSGKTVLAIELLIQLFDERALESDPDAPVPVPFSITSFAADQPLESWLGRQLGEDFKLSPRVAKELVRRRLILPVLDGLDELDADEDEPVRAARVVDRINGYVDGRARASIVVTCRAGHYDRLTRRIDDATTVEIQELNAERIAAYLATQVRDPSDELAWAEILDPLRSQPDGATAELLVKTLSTPWLLTLAVTAYRAGADPRDLLGGGASQHPTSAGGDGRRATQAASADAHAERVKQMLLERFVAAATQLHSNGYGDPYRHHEVQNWLRFLARRLGRLARHQRSGKDIALHELWTLVGPVRTRVLHAILAGLLVLIAMAGAALSLVPLAAIDLSRAWQVWSSSPMEPSFTAAVLVVALGVVLLPGLAAGIAAQRTPVPSRLDLGQLRTRRGRRRFLLGTAVGLAGGAASGLVLGLAVGAAGGLSVGIKFGLLYGMAGGTSVGAAFGLAFGLDQTSSEAVHPGRVVREDLVYGLAYGAMVGVASGIAGGISIGPGYGLAVGLGIGVAYGLLLGPVVAVRYAIAVAFAAARGRLPARLAPFLDWAVKAGLLRVAGIAYQFRHRDLQAWLANAPAVRSGSIPAPRAPRASDRTG